MSIHTYPAGSAYPQLGFGVGVANHLALWQDADTLTSDPELYYDPTNNYLGIGTATPTAPLTFGHASSQKIHFDVEGNEYYGISREFLDGFFTDQLNIFVPQSTDATIALGHHEGTFGYFNPTLRVKPEVVDIVGKLGIGMAAPTSALDVRGSVVASDAANTYYGVRVWPAALAGAENVQGLRVEAATGAGLATSSIRAITVLNQPAALGAMGIQLLINAGASRYNMYASGSADNYFAGNVGLKNIAPSYPLDVTGQARVTGNVGIGTAPSTAPLTFAPSIAQKIHLYGVDAERYGFAIDNSQLQVFSAGAAKVSLGSMNNTDGVTFTNILDVSTAGVAVPGSPVGFSTPPVAGWGLRVGPYPVAFGSSLYVTGITSTTTLAVNRAAPIGHDMYVGWMAADAASFGRGNAAPRWSLDCSAPGHIAQLGCYYGPPTNTDLRVFRGAFDSLSLNRGDNAARWQLDCEGYGYIARLGIAGGPDERWHFTNWGSSYFNGTAEFVGVVGVGGAPNGSYNLTNHGTSYLYGLVGCGTTPYAGWSLTASTILAWNAIQSSNTLYVVGTSVLASWTGIRGAADGRFAVRAYSDIYCDGVPYNGGGGPWVAYSDRRLKHLHGEIPHPLETMCALHGLLYEYSDTAMGRPAGVRMGVVAQEVEAVIPEWVGELDGFKTTQLSSFEALTIESFKALAARVAALEGD